MFSREGRFRLFLAFLILVLVLVNSQSLQVSYQTRALLTELFEESTRDTAELVAAALLRLPDSEPRASTNDFLETEAAVRGLRSACVLNWDARLVTGGRCAPPQGEAFDRLDRSGRRRLLENGWAMTAVSPSYDVERAEAAGYLVMPASTDPDGSSRVLRVVAPARGIAEANRRFRMTLIYQVSALSLVLLAVILFLNSMLAPQRRLVAEARSVATELSAGGAHEGDEGQFLLATFQDVVQRLKEKEKELAALHLLEKTRADETEALASDIIRSMTTGLVSVDPDGSVALVNPAAERIFGIAQEAVRGEAFRDVFDGSDELAELVGLALDEGSYHLRGRARYRKADAGSLHLGVSVLPLLSAEGSPKGALCLLADLTEVVELRERLFLKDNLARLGEMVAGIAHEFRNGLATIMGNARLLEGQVRAESEEVVAALVEESRSLSRVVSEFLEFARPEPLTPERVDLEALVRELTEELRGAAEGEGVTLRARTKPVLVEADERLLRKALSNLVVNAIDSVGTCPSGEGAVEVELETAEEAALVRIRDNGPGIAPEDRQKIFTPFFTGKANGTGLGLSVVQKIVVSHNGSVELEETPTGASFLVRLPLTSQTPATPADWV